MFLEKVFLKSNVNLDFTNEFNDFLICFILFNKPNKIKKKKIKQYAGHFRKAYGSFRSGKNLNN